MTTFDGFNHLKKMLGFGRLFKDGVSLYNALDTNETSILRFASVPGPVNLAICTSSNSKIPLQEINSCLLTTCTTGFAAGFWAQPPPKSFLADRDILMLHIGIFKLFYGPSLCNGTVFSSFKFQVEIGGQLCTWTSRENCTSLQGWTQMLFSFDTTKNYVFVIVDGVMEVPQKIKCEAATSSVPRSSSIGGSAMHICMDNLVLWDTPVNTSFAMKTCCAFSYCGKYLNNTL